jgi:hypothetical protein
MHIDEWTKFAAAARRLAAIKATARLARKPAAPAGGRH